MNQEKFLYCRFSLFEYSLVLKYPGNTTAERIIEDALDWRANLPCLKSWERCKPDIKLITKAEYDKAVKK